MDQRERRGAELALFALHMQRYSNNKKDKRQPGTFQLKGYPACERYFKWLVMHDYIPL